MAIPEVITVQLDHIAREGFTDDDIHGYFICDIVSGHYDIWPALVADIDERGITADVFGVHVFGKRPEPKVAVCLLEMTQHGLAAVVALIDRFYHRDFNLLRKMECKRSPNIYLRELLMRNEWSAAAAARFDELIVTMSATEFDRFHYEMLRVAVRKYIEMSKHECLIAS